MGFSILYAGTKNNLLSQTTKRLRKGLKLMVQITYYKLLKNQTLEYAKRIRNALEYWF